VEDEEGLVGCKEGNCYAEEEVCYHPSVIESKL